MPPVSPLTETTTAAGAAFVDDAGWRLPLHYGEPAAEYQAAHDRAVVLDVSNRGKIEVAGRDAATFLHNLSTADIKSLALGNSCEAFLATAKAKAIAYLRVFHRPTAFWLDVEPVRGSAVFQHLDHFLISEQVELSDRTNELAQLRIRGPEAGQIVKRAFGPEIDSGLDVRQFDPLTFDILCAPEQAADIWRALLQAGVSPAGLQTLETLRVEAGLPRWGAEIDESRSVFEVGLNERAICYTKGCYLGQEPIVMARDRGHINRTLRGLRINAAAQPLSGAKVWHNGQEIGQVTSSVHSPRLGAIALAYLKRGSQETGLAVEVETGPETRADATVAALPFAL